MSATPAAGHRYLDAMRAQPLLLGLFLPIQNGGWSPSTAPRTTDWTFEYNRKLTQRAEAIGFDLAFGLAQWRGKGGYGGVTRYRETSIDPLITVASLAAVTERIVLISTIHILYGPWHPLHLAKFGATLDHISGGRWGLNVVTGFAPGEREMFGHGELGHDRRYQMAAEFTEILERLWATDANITFEGESWTVRDAFVSPRPLYGRPILVNAASSSAGLDYAAKYSDLIFITSPAGAEIEAALDALPAHNAAIRARAAAHGREVMTLINPMVICRETEREAQEVYRAILAGEDPVAVDGIYGSMQVGDTRSWRGHKREQRIVGGNIQLVGSPEQVAERFLQLKRAGCDGVQISFFDFQPDLDFFGERVTPLLRQAGLRR